MAATNEAEKKHRAEGQEEGNDRTDNCTMGRKYIVPYGLYRSHGFISAKLAERTGFSDAELDTLREALVAMFEHDHSAARGEMAMRKAIAFKHANALGNAPAHALFDRVKVGRSVDGEFRKIDRRLDNLPPAREFTDYAIETKRRVVVPFDAELRRLTEDTAAAFAALVAQGRTPPPVWKTSRCRPCSLIELCRPQAMTKSALGFRQRALAAALDVEPAPDDTVP